MAAFVWIFLATVLISLVSFVGILTLFLKEKFLNKILVLLVAFSAGALIGGAFLHLIPEAVKTLGIEGGNLLQISLSLIFGFCIFFLLEHLIKWHHHHATFHPEIMPFSYLILISDGVHNFIDGLIIAGSFMVSVPIGLVTALAVALHEIPQEIGDYGVLVYGGIKKIKALFLNFVSASAIILGGIVGFFLSGKIGEQIAFLLSFAAGSFIYIAASDFIPLLKEEKDFGKSAIHFLVFLAGIFIMLLIKLSYE